jgi:molecular chaperone DnaJ
VGGEPPTPQCSMARDYYAVLGIGVAATPTEVRRAYQRLARQYSPDVNLWDRGAKDLFEEILEAYRVLSDPTARALYDRHGSGDGRATAPSRESSGARRGRRGDDLHVAVELDFAQAVRGASTELSLERLSPCEACGASGAEPGARTLGCGHCGGTGAVWSGVAGGRPEPCPACEGAGERVSAPCRACRGRGVVPVPAMVWVVIPPGVDSGAQLRVPGEGHSGPFGGPRGDLIVITRVHDDAVFTRKGDNLYCNLPIALTEAVLGARVSVATLLGPVDLVIPPGTQGGQVLRVRGKGMPRLTRDGRGDLYLTVTVEIPRGIDARTQDLFRELDRLLPGRPQVPIRRVERA